MTGLGFLATLPVADDLAAEPAEARPEDVDDRQVAVGQAQTPCSTAISASSTPWTREAIARTFA